MAEKSEKIIELSEKERLLMEIVESERNLAGKREFSVKEKGVN